VPEERLARDTSLEIEQLQIERWRDMTPLEKAALITGLTQAAFELSAAGVRHRYPNSSPREQFLRLAIITLGPELARAAYPDIERLDRVDSSR
jgi:hypothetical protein